MLVLFVLLNSFSFIQCVRILGFFPTPSYSNQIIFQPIWKQLSLRGHNVTVVTPQPLYDPSLTNLTEIDIPFAYDILSKYGWPNEYVKLASTLHRLDYLLHAGKELTMNIWEYGPVQHIINDQHDKFDLLIVQVAYNVNLLLNSLAFKFRTPIVGKSVN
ncbi:UDP-glycosyltransferase UGT4-like [Diabrotica virgifera virgifera]|uniref:Ecdysteroid UDP-glucosyltransferase n=1 Tax=Diabrotica virgifera virgifera TaxID=50390 RepID=A0ABM5L2U7_DIAVI|nr:UDP-glycosyltransferase UGT4-like [Diabrotica virgifera virgifera]